jgi:hypothetical protein
MIIKNKEKFAIQALHDLQVLIIGKINHEQTQKFMQSLNFQKILLERSTKHWDNRNHVRDQFRKTFSNFIWNLSIFKSINKGFVKSQYVNARKKRREPENWTNFSLFMQQTENMNSGLASNQPNRKFLSMCYGTRTPLKERNYAFPNQNAALFV